MQPPSATSPAGGAYVPAKADRSTRREGNGDGGHCVEIGSDFPGAALWRKSSHSDAGGGECVEVADNVPGLVPVRDSKSPGGPALLLPAAAWAPFIDSLRSR
ncbi:DUF397 domain-containing protein [Streptomyces sp. NPDC029006]|uniref:DUF397 domain-containing protein n=1 Tax=Streptomyces sp. NPDC029006 TaxID=3155467 RepID=UPI0033F678CB